MEKTRSRAILIAAAVLILSAAVIVMVFSSGGPGKAESGIRIDDPVFSSSGTSPAGNTALFSKFVSPDTPSIIVDLDSGDPADPLSLTILTPDKTLGPYNDSADGRMDGRIYLKISKTDRMTPGLWRFMVYSANNISMGQAGTP